MTTSKQPCEVNFVDLTTTTMNFIGVNLCKHITGFTLDMILVILETELTTNSRVFWDHEVNIG